MRIVLLADESFARREIEMLRRLEVGLLSQGHRVCLALPEAMLRESDALSLGSPTPYRLRGGPISRTHRIRQFLDRLDFEDSESSTDRAIDVVHVFGEQAWGFAARLATRVDAALVVECWSLAALHEASVLHRYLDPSATRTLWLAPSESMGRIAAEAMPKARIETCHWGVHIDEHPHHRDHARRHLVTQSEQRIVADEPVEEETGDNPVTVVVLSSESGVPEFMALLEALALLVAEERSLMAFVSEAAFRSERRSWKTVVRLDLASRICITPDVESRRDLVLSADMAILPDHSGRHRSIALDAMAAGIPLVASPDPAVGWLNPSTCKLIAQASVQGWADAIRELIRSEREAEMLGLSARDHIRAYHLSSTHLHSLIAHYRALVETQSPIAFEQA